MYKIEIDWGFRSPSLGILTGEVRIDNIDMGMISKNVEPCIIKKERGTTGYKNCPSLFTRAKPLVDIMVHAYFDGMLMEEKSLLWFQNAFRKNNVIHTELLD